MELIGWILIGICCFYLLRNFYVGSMMVPLGNQILITYNRIFEKRPYLQISPAYRNYYLLVLNPFHWHFLEIFKNDLDGRKLKVLWKECFKEAKNLRNLK